MEEIMKRDGYNKDLDKNVLPLFAMPTRLELCRGSLEWLQFQAKASLFDDNIQCILWNTRTRSFLQTKIHIKVYELPFMFMEVLQAAKAPCPFPNVTLAEDKLAKDVYLFTHGVSCQFHSSTENPGCAAGEAIRRCFNFMDYGCRACGVNNLIEGRHTPHGVDPAEDITSSSSDSKSVSSRSSRRTMEDRELSRVVNFQGTWGAGDVSISFCISRHFNSLTLLKKGVTTAHLPD
jgi:hypothetical protein